MDLRREGPKKRPLLTAGRLQIMRRVPYKPKKGNPREEFEKLSRQPARCPQTYQLGATYPYPSSMTIKDLHLLNTVRLGHAFIEVEYFTCGVRYGNR
jgi:hypothetical protein